MTEEHGNINPVLTSTDDYSPIKPAPYIADLLHEQQESKRSLQAEAAELSFSEKFKIAQEEELTLTVLHRNMQDYGDEDPNFKITSDMEKELSKTLEPRYIEELKKKAHNQAAYNALTSQYEVSQHNEKLLGVIGLEGLGYRALAAFTDPTEWAIVAATEGLATPIAAASKLGRLGRLGFRGIIGAVDGGATEAMKQIDVNHTPIDFLFAAGVGAAMNTSLGAVADFSFRRDMKLQQMLKTTQEALVKDPSSLYRAEPVLKASDLDKSLNIPEGSIKLNSKASFKDKKQLEALFGKKIIFYDDEKNLTNSKGFMMPEDSERIFINSTSSDQAASVFGHELAHHIRKESPALWNSLAKAAKTTDDEKVSNIIGSLFNNPEALKNIITKAEGGLKDKLNLNVKQFFEKLSKSVEKTDYFEDFRATRHQLENSISLYLKENPPSRSLNNGGNDYTTVKFSKDIESKVSSLPVESSMLKVRYGAYKTLASSSVKSVRDATEHLILDSVGKKGAVTSQAGGTASEINKILELTGKAKFYQTYNVSFRKWQNRQGFKLWETDKARTQFNESVGKAFRNQKYTENPEVDAVITNIQEHMKDILQRAKDAGVHGFEDIPTNSWYLPRLYDTVSINRLYGVLGENLNRLFAKALRQGLIEKGVTEIDEAKIMRISKHMLKVTKDSHSGLMSTVSSDFAKYNKETLVDLLENFDIPNNELSEILETFDAMKKASDGKVKHAKQRLPFDEDVEETFIGIDGNEYTVNIQDLFINDAERLFLTYNNTMSGHIALAEKGFKSKSDFQKLTHEARGAGEENTAKTLEFVYKELLGMPIDKNPYSKLNHLARGIRDLNVITRMGQVGFSMLAESGNLVGQVGLKHVLQSVPHLKSIFKRAEDGKLSDDLLAELEEFTGIGSEFMTHSPLTRGDDDYEYLANEASNKFFNRDLGTVKHLTSTSLDKAKRITSVLGGMTPMNTFNKRLTLASLSHKLVKMAHGEADIPVSRLAWLGLGDQMKARVFDQIKKHTVYKDVAGKRIKQLGLNNWNDEEALAALQTFLFRATNKIVQEPDIGDMLPFMKTELGKLLFQFKGFTISSWSKQLLSEIHHRDWNTFNSFIASTTLATLGYITQTYANHYNDPWELRKRLEVSVVAKNGFAKSTYASLLPTAWDTGASMLGYEAAFSYARSTGLASDIIGGSPAKQVLDSSDAFLRLFRSVLDPSYDFSKSDFYKLRNFIFFQNVLGVKQILDSIQDTLPNEYRG
ncbi:MAG: hypothetical protein C0603_06725 [Denitrovibrio sp.]|nr:MAG: hypothetical protein C0603_06725 [Denitrovibrio sp.]